MLQQQGVSFLIGGLFSARSGKSDIFYLYGVYRRTANGENSAGTLH